MLAAGCICLLAFINCWSVKAATKVFVMIIVIVIIVKTAIKVLFMIIVFVYDHCQGGHQGVSHDHCFFFL